MAEAVVAALRLPKLILIKNYRTLRNNLKEVAAEAEDELREADNEVAAEEGEEEVLK